MGPALLLAARRLGRRLGAGGEAFLEDRLGLCRAVVARSALILAGLQEVVGLLAAGALAAVSYTHLDVYKRQALTSARSYDNDGAITAPGDDEWRSLQRKEDTIRAAALWLQAHAGPKDYVATDHQLVAAWADRRVAPPLAAFSSRAVGIGAFDDATLVGAVERYRVPAILLWDAEIAAFPRFRAWIADRCGPPQIDLGSDRFGYLCGQSTLGGAESRSAPVARFRTADLLGHAQDWHEGRLELRLFWQARAASDRPLSVSVHVMAVSYTHLVAGEVLGRAMRLRST